MSEACDYCLGAGTVPNWIYRPKQKCFVRPLDRPFRDCPECGGTGVTLEYDTSNVIPPSRALVTKESVHD